MSSLSETLRAGTIVEYIQSNQPVMGWIQEMQGSKVRIVNINQREMKLPAGRILPWAGPHLPETSSKADVLQTLKTLHAARETLAEAIDPMELWELAQGEIQYASIDWLAALLWETPDADHKAALGRKLLAARTHFKFSPPRFEIHPQKTVEKRIKEMRQKEERERLVAQGQAFFKELWQGYRTHRGLSEMSDMQEPQDAEKLKELLMNCIRQSRSEETQPLFKKMTAGLPDLPFLALHLAEAWEIIPKHYNYLLDQAGYVWDDANWSGPFAQEVQALKERVCSMSQPAECTDAVSIDSASTRDIDDGFYVTKKDDGYHLEIILACPALGWKFGSRLDKTVMERFSSIYLPEGTSNMLPLDVGTDFFSLHAGQNRPALILGIHLDLTGQVLDFTPRYGWTCLNRNLTYDAVQENLDADQTEPMLQAADELAALLRSRRIANGAVIMQQPEPVISLSFGTKDTKAAVEVSLTPGEEENSAQVLVSEYMILANSLMAQWALAHDVPMLFRTQNITLPKGSAGVWTASGDIFRLIKSMGPSILEARPKPHATLAAKAYTSITSPLRRYADFINAAQILATLTSQRPAWTQDDLEAALPFLNARAQAVGKVQRFWPRYWKYLFFQQQAKKQQWQGEVVEHNDRMVTVALRQEQLFLKAPASIFGGKVRMGQIFSLRMGKVDPLHNELFIAEASEV